MSGSPGSRPVGLPGGPLIYTPSHFAIEDREVLFDHIERTGLALLIGVGVEGPLASHAPMLLERNQGPSGRLVGHLAKANPHWQEALGEKPALAVFQGPDAYITPSWYPSSTQVWPASSLPSHSSFPPWRVPSPHQPVQPLRSNSHALLQASVPP